MKQCILTGGGSKFGALLTEEFINAGYYVHLITSNGERYKDNKQINVIDVDWNSLNMLSLRKCIPDVSHIDVLFFNHNASSLTNSKFLPTTMQNQKDWQQSYFVACQFPYYYVNLLSKKLSNSSKIGWMLSELIKWPLESHLGFADYIGNKFTNALIMKNFALTQDKCFFGLYPEYGVDEDALHKAKNIIHIIDSYSRDQLNGNILASEGYKLNLFV